MIIAAVLPTGTITVVPAADALTEGTESVILTLSAKAAYAVAGAPNNSATVNIAEDTVAPTVTARSPAPNATGVPINTTVTATFSEAVNATTVNTNTFFLVPNGSITHVTATVNLVGNTATLTPSSPLNPLANYIATVVGGARGVKDAGGNPLVADDTWSFTTGTSCLVGFSSSTLNFFEPTLPIGTPSAARSVTVTNTGGSPVAISGVVFGGPSGADFSQTNDCGASLADGASCTVSVTFTPSAAGVRVGEMTLTTTPSNAGKIYLIGNRNAGSFTDVQGDGRGDVLWRHLSAGHVVVWLMNRCYEL